MFHHVKELQFNARVTKPDPQFARVLLEQFGGGNGELKAAMQYFVQAFGVRRSHPAVYDLLMDTATEEFSHLEIVGATITMLLDGINGELKDAAEKTELTKLMKGKSQKESFIHEAMTNPQFLVLSGGGPTVTDSVGTPWSGSFVNANGDLTVDLRSNIGAESRAKIVYEYLLQFTDDKLVKESLMFLMTREITHFQQFSAALATIEPNFPPGVLQGDPRYSHKAFNMSQGEDARGPWNQNQGPWPKGEQWHYIEEPLEYVEETDGLVNAGTEGNARDPKKLEKLAKELGKQRKAEAQPTAPVPGENIWSSYSNGH